MKFHYQARTQKGEVQSGEVEASSQEAALKVLERQGFFVTLLEEAAAAPLYAKRLEFFDRISKKEVMLFSRQLSIMFRSQVSLVESLRTLAKQIKRQAFREKVLNLSEQVEGGTSLSDALATHPDTFSAFYVNMVKSGEASGKLSEVLDYLADHLEREYELVSKIRGALVYPAFVLALAVLVLFLMMFFVIPNLTEVFEQSGQELPLATRLVLGLSALTRSFWWLLLLLFGGGGVLLYQYFQTQGGRNLWSRTLVKIPVAGAFFRTIYLSRFAENLSTLISGGVPIAQSLEITGNIVGNDIYRGIIMDAKQAVQRGDSISSVLERHPEEFPPVFSQMVYVGERSGSLDATLLNVVRFYEGEVRRTIEAFLSIIEPALVVTLGLIVGGMMAAILLPLYQLANV